MFVLATMLMQMYFYTFCTCVPLFYVLFRALFFLRLLSYPDTVLFLHFYVRSLFATFCLLRLYLHFRIQCVVATSACMDFLNSNQPKQHWKSSMTNMNVDKIQQRSWSGETIIFCGEKMKKDSNDWMCDGSCVDEARYMKFIDRKNRDTKFIIFKRSETNENKMNNFNLSFVDGIK